MAGKRGEGSRLGAQVLLRGPVPPGPDCLQHQHAASLRSLEPGESLNTTPLSWHLLCIHWKAGAGREADETQPFPGPGRSREHLLL